MPTIFQLNIAVNSLEADSSVHAGNLNETGLWLRFALAAEQLAGASSSANANVLGYMLRSAVALESIAGTNGTAENISYEGYLKRIVDALEVQAGAVTAGSLAGRLVVAANAAAYGAPSPTLSALTLATPTVAENTAPGVTVGAIVGKTSGSTLSLTASASGRFAISGGNLVTGSTATDYETATSHSITIRETLAGATNTPRDTTLTVTVTDVDEIAPTLSSPADAANGATGATLSVSTNEANGTLYWYVSTSGTAPSAANLKSGSGAAAFGNQAVSATGTQNVSTSGLTASTAYYAHFLHRDAAGNDSSIASADGFTTAAPADVTAPTLSSPADAANGGTGASLSVSTNEGNGTLYWFISTSGTAPSAANLKAGTGAVSFGNQAVSATGTQNISATGLSASTAYYAHFLHRDAAGNDSSIASGDGFTTTAGAPSAPNYLSAVDIPHAVYGAQRLVSGYSGPLFRVRRADATELDISCATGGDYPDYAALATWAGASIPTVTTLYDQSGNSRDLTQATATSQPLIDVTDKRGNVAPILFRGVPTTEANSSACLMTNTGGMGMDLISVSTFATFQAHRAFSKQSFFTHGAISLKNNGSNLIVEHSAQITSNIGTVGMQPLSNASTYGLRQNTTTTSLYTGGAVLRTAGAVKTTTALPDFTLGTGVNNDGARFRFFGLATYNSTVSDANATAIQTSLDTAFTVNNTDWDYNLVLDGDSIMQGGSYALFYRDIRSLMGVRDKAKAYLTAVYGQNLSSVYSGRTGRFPATYSAARPSVIFVQAGTNDLGGTTGADLYNNSFAPLVAYLKGLGFLVIGVTILPKSAWAAGSTNDIRRTDYNTLMKTNTDVAAVCDWAGDPIMGDNANNSNATYYADGLHPADAGYVILSALTKATLQSVLRTTALGGSYVV